MKNLKIKENSLIFKWVSIIIILYAIPFVNTKSNAQVNVTDSLALVSFYNTTNGPNWYNHTNWLTGPVSTWHGVQTIGTDRVINLFLANNNLTGFMSEDFFGLDSLVNLNLGKNHLTGTIPSAISSFSKLVGLALFRNHFTSPIPLSLGSMSHLYHFYISDNDFTGTFPDTLLKKLNNSYAYIIDTNHFTDLPYINYFPGAIWCRNNNLTFEDILPYSQSSIITEFKYNTQDSIGNLYDTLVTVGDSIVLDSWCGGSGNLYKWKKDGFSVSGWDTISTLPINNIQLTQGGYFTCEVTNPGAPLLTLERRMIHVLVNLPDAIDNIVPDQNPMVSFNPDNAFLRIQLRFNAKTPVNAYLYDMMGRKVLTLFTDNTSYQDLHYYLSWLKPGIYLVNLQYAGIQKSNKILIR